MRIKSLYIEEYKLLKKFNINFNKEISILIGINGSGKSTILETIAQIFSDAYLDEKSKFGFKLNYDIRIEGFLNQSTTFTELKSDYLNIEITASSKGEFLKYKINEKSRSVKEIYSFFGSIEKILPSNIVIYYSGFAEVMKKICLPHDKKFSTNYRLGSVFLNRPFFYFEPELFNLILITLLSYEFGDIPKFLRERARITGLKSIIIKLKKPSWGKGSVENWWGAKGEAKVFLEYLNSLQKSLHFDSNSSYSPNKNVIIESWNNENLIITILGLESLFDIREHFIEEKNLFKILNTLIIDGFQPEIDVNLIHETNLNVKFNNLSEGEQQAIVIRGLVELVTNENTLFLFDEPDTYLHPIWQRNFIENIGDLSENNFDYDSQFLITTHSPQLLSNADPSKCDVQIIEDGEIVKITPKFYGKDISTILYELMGVEKRNVKVVKLLSELFDLIENESIEEAEIELKKLSELLGDDDPSIVRARLQLDYLQEKEDETNN